ncbi:MAG: hypothetical protein JWO51_3309 [Rhodospirillales bacterium]|nr:hypothetical protein [Rhodospirillales bacterium]
MKSFILLTALLLTLSGGLAACTMQLEPSKPDTDEHARGGY